jgi:hypothetical protein
MGAKDSRYALFFSDPLPLFNAVDITAEATSRSIGCQGYNSISLYSFLDFTACTAVLYNIDVQHEGSTNWFPLTSVSVAGGTGTRAVYTDSTATGGADKKFIANFAIPEGSSILRVRVIGTGATDDTLTTHYCLTQAAA